MPFVPVFSILTPLIGIAVLLIVANLPWLRPYRRFVPPVGAGLVLLAVLFAAFEPLQTVIVSRWQPSMFFGAFPALVADRAVLPLVLAFSCAVAASTLVQVSRLPQPPYYLGISALGMLAAGLMALWGENLLTVLIAWVGFDLAWGLGALAAGLSVRRAVLGAGLNGLATLALWVAALMVEPTMGGFSWRLLLPTGVSYQFLVLAGLLRLGLYPLHLALPLERGRGLPGAVPLALGPLLGWGLLARLATVSGGLQTWPWVEGWAALALLAGGVLAWTRQDAAGGWPWAAMAAAGAVLWASIGAGEAALLPLAGGGAAWVLGVSLLALDRGLARPAPWRSIPALVGGLALIGAPLTMGLYSTAYVTRLIAADFSLLRLLAFVLGQGLLIAAVLQRLLRPAADEESPGPLFEAAYWAGIALPLLVALIGGFFPRLLAPARPALSMLRLLALPGIVGWLLWLVGVAVGGALSWLMLRLRRQWETARGLAHDFLRLEWLYGLALDSTAQVTAFLGAVADVLEGPGAILWALAIFFLILQALVRR